MILEAIVTTRNPDGTTNVAPMGPHCDDPEMKSFELRPFCTSTTWQNLKRTGQGVLHVTDDVLLFAMAATGSTLDGLNLQPATQVQVNVLADSCRCYEFETSWFDDLQTRAVVHCRTLHSQRFRDFFGFNRACHAIIEASILATRINFLPQDEVENRFNDFETLVAKTGGTREQEAFRILKSFLAQATSSTVNSPESIEMRQS